MFALSGNRCAFPKCTTPLIHEAVLTGEVCHIKAASPEGPRYDPNQTDKERHALENLVVLCQPHHTVIDADVRPPLPRVWSASPNAACCD